MPVPSLPLELVALIVEYLVPAPDCAIGESNADRRHRVLVGHTIGAVCRSWRPLGLKIAWRTLDIVLDLEHDEQFRRIWQPEVFDRVAPLISHLRVAAGRQIHLAGMARTFSERCTALTSLQLVHADTLDAFFLQASPHTLSRLVELTWEAPTSSTTSLNGVLLAASNLPSLRFLAIHATGGSFTLDRDLLTSLTSASTRRPRLRRLSLALLGQHVQSSRRGIEVSPTVVSNISHTTTVLLGLLPTIFDLSSLIDLRLAGALPIDSVQSLFSRLPPALPTLDVVLDAGSRSADKRDGRDFLRRLPTLLTLFPRLQRLLFSSNCGACFIDTPDRAAAVLSALPSTLRYILLPYNLHDAENDGLQRFLESSARARDFVLWLPEFADREGHRRWVAWRRKGDVWERRPAQVPPRP
ncbi:hypothetical protein JCM10213_005072 [Rhodosporidiobolus nylandii]